VLFSEYINLLKAHFCKSISNEELCGILFDSVIVPLDLRNKRGEPFLLDKATISKVMNNRQNVPQKIRDNIYEPAVLSGIVGYFDDNIVSELVPKRDDLCFQMMGLLRVDRMLSPQHLAEFQMLATPSSIGAFLAEVFAYVVMADVHADRTPAPEHTAAAVAGEKSSHPELVLRGVHEGRLSDSGVIESLLSRPGPSFATQRDKVIALFKEAMDLHPIKASTPFSFSIYSPVKIGEDEQELLKEVAEHLGLVLPADFFELGDLESDHFPTVVLGGAEMHGSPEAKEKYRAIHDILEMLEEIAKASPFMDGFKKARCLALAVENEGTGFDEDVRVQIALPKESILSFEDILELDEAVLEYMAYGCDFDGIFGIKRGADFLAYESSCRKDRPMKLSPQRLPGFLGGKDPDFGDVIPTLFDFDMVEREFDWQIEVEFDEIMQHTAVAFPELVLLKGDLVEVEYTIRSKHMADIISGSIRIEKGF